MIIYVLCGVIIIQAVLHYRERKDLYNRIMSKNLAEYKSEPVKNGARVISAHDRAIRKWREM